MIIVTLILCILQFVNCYPPSHTIPNVPYDKQVTVYDCGCASLQMVFAYWNVTQVSQYSLANIARTSAILGTAGLDIVRTGHFSILSSSAGLDFPDYSLPNGIPGKPIGFASFGNDGEQWLDDLKGCIAANTPIIILMKYALNDTGGHYRVAVGYDENNQTITLHDPWGRDNQPHNITFSYTDFMDLWNYTEKAAVPAGPFFGALITPFTLQTQFFTKTASQLVIQTVATYPSLPQTPKTTSIIANTLVSLNLPFPSNFAIAKNSSQTLNLGSVAPGDYVKAMWEVECPTPSCNNFTANIEVKGVVAGNVPYAKWVHAQFYPPYSYTDIIGGSQIIPYY